MLVCWYKMIKVLQTVVWSLSFSPPPTQHPLTQHTYTTPTYTTHTTHLHHTPLHTTHLHNTPTHLKRVRVQVSAVCLQRCLTSAVKFKSNLGKLYRLRRSYSSDVAQLLGILVIALIGPTTIGILPWGIACNHRRSNQHAASDGAVTGWKLEPGDDL